MYTLTLARFHEVGSREVEVGAYIYSYIHIHIYFLRPTFFAAENFESKFQNIESMFQNIESMFQMQKKCFR